MSSISTGPAPVFPSPKVRGHDRIAAQTASGAISGTDRTALDTAVDSIDAALKGSDGPGAAPSARLEPADLKARIDDLIGQQVQGGRLTSDQAETLKSVLGGEAGGSSGAGVAAAPAADTTAQSTNDLLATFVRHLQSRQDQTSPYGAGGTRAATPSASALLMNFKV